MYGPPTINIHRGIGSLRRKRHEASHAERAAGASDVISAVAAWIAAPRMSAAGDMSDESCQPPILRVVP
jgi:hypothetical protein